MAVSEKILLLKQETNSITSNPVLDSFNIDELKLFEEKAIGNSQYKKKLKDIENLLSKVTYVYDKKYLDAYSIYNELVVFEMLSKKTEIEIVQEKKESKTPDFRIILDRTEYVYADLKTLNFANGNQNYKDIQEQGFNSKIGLENQIKSKRKGIYFSEPIYISPFKKGNNQLHYDIKVIIEEIINKATNNYKSAQVNYFEISGIYLIDLTQLLITPGLEQGLPVTEGRLYKEPNSGILWNIAFGRLGDPIYNWIEFEGKPNITNRLSKNGLLVNEEEVLKDLRAIVFITGFGDQKQIIGFHRTSETSQTLLNILYNICDFVNDETNSKYYELKRLTH